MPSTCPSPRSTPTPPHPTPSHPTPSHPAFCTGPLLCKECCFTWSTAERKQKLCPCCRLCRVPLLFSSSQAEQSRTPFCPQHTHGALKSPLSTNHPGAGLLQTPLPSLEASPEQPPCATRANVWPRGMDWRVCLKSKRPLVAILCFWCHDGDRHPAPSATSLPPLCSSSGANGSSHRRAEQRLGRAR